MVSMQGPVENVRTNHDFVEARGLYQLLCRDHICVPTGEDSRCGVRGVDSLYWRPGWMPRPDFERSRLAAQACGRHPHVTRV
jgi:hypothetical protein